MTTLNDIKARLPDWAKDIRLNLDATIQRSSLDSRPAPRWPRRTQRDRLHWSRHSARPSSWTTGTPTRR
jgi:hypothetical protein